jgi:uncharacterized SAM-binding protein YcdF (DUF218 family)
MGRVCHWNLPDQLPNKPDCFIALSYAVGGDRRLTPMTRVVLDKILFLNKLFPHAKIIVSTGDNQHLGITNAHLMKEYLVAKGVEYLNIISEDKSANTYENIKYSFALVARYKLVQPVLVTYDLHLRRSLAAVRKLGFNCGWVSATTNEVRMGKRKWWQINRASMLTYEGLAYLVSKVAGWA